MRGNAVTALVTLVLLFSAPAALAATGGHATGPQSESWDGTSISMVQQHSTNNSSVSVGVGQQLSTVVVQADSDVRAEYEESSLDAALASANESARADILAERADSLADRAAELRDGYREATQAYAEGDLSRDAYAQRLATLNARAENVQTSIARTRERAEEVSALDLRAAGYSTTELSSATRALDVLTGAGLNDLRDRFTGTQDGDVDLDRDDDSLSVSVSNSDGDITREVERSRDENDSFTISQTDALQRATSALRTPSEGAWSLERTGVDRADGAYTFTYTLTGANATGHATVAVDGSTGIVFSLTSEVETADDGDDTDTDDSDDEDESDDSDTADTDGDDAETGDEEQDGDGGLTVLVTNGTLDSDSQITVQALDANGPVANATVVINGSVVGTTGENGTLTLSAPSDDSSIRVTARNASGTLDLDVEADEDEELAANIDAVATALDGEVTIAVTYAGTGVSGATVLANGQAVGTTGPGGTVTFSTNTTSGLDVTVVKGEFRASFTFSEANGSYTRTDTTIGESDDNDGDDEDADDDDSDDGDSNDGDDGDTDDGDDSGTDSDSDSDDSDTNDGDSTDSDTNDGDSTDSDTNDGDSTDSDSTTTTSSTDNSDTNDSDANEGD